MSQATAYVIPNSPESGPNLIAFLDAIIAALASLSSGPTAPINGPGAGNSLVAYQLWEDTSVNPPVLRQYNGSGWVPAFPSLYSFLHANFGGL